jgi:hypothetical protein
MKKWVKAFVEAFRLEGSELEEDDKKCFEPFVKEQLLSAPCAVEVVELRNPYRLFLIFLFGEGVKDLKISVHRRKWADIGAFVDNLLLKYSGLNIDFELLVRMLVNFKSSDDMDYGIDLRENVCTLAFTRDVRIFPLNVALSVEPDSGPSAAGRSIFRLNYSQALDRYWQEDILKKAVAELTGSFPPRSDEELY